MLLVVVMAVLSWGTQCDGVFLAEIDITGLQGSVTIDTESKTLMANFSSACHHDVEVSIHEFPVIYGAVWDPCDADNIGHSLYNISLKNGLQSQFVVKTSLVACSLVVKTCDLKACTNLYESSGHFHAWRSTFRSFLVGHIYIMQEMNANSTTVISELAFLEGFPASPASLYFADSCQIQVNKSWVINEVGSRMKIAKSRKELPLISMTRFAVLEYEGKVTCTELITIRSKEASANFSMTGIIGSFIVRQESPFHPSKLNIDLLNHRWLASHLTIHTFPVPARQTLEQDLCSHIGIGDLWNPLGINSNDPSYPSSPSNSHSRWEIGDLSGRHGPLQGLKEVKAVLIDYNLPLFGNNSIVGRSVVITSTNGSKRVCSTILQEEGMIMALASFRKTIVGRVMFRQPVAALFDDLSILIELSSVSGITSLGHNWHVHELPLQTEADSCTSAGSHFNPFNVPTGGSYNQECGSHNPLLCETGDYAGRHMALTFQANSTVRYFFTDTSSSLAGPTSIIGKSLVIHVANGGAMRMACANILHLQPVEGRTSSWLGPGKARGELRVLQSSDLEATHVTFNFTDLNRSAGGFHIHQLPVIEGSSNPCSNDLITGHFNPFQINVSASPPEGMGSHDEYEVGDISGRQGSLVNKDRANKRYEDTNLPLSGSHSILGRSLVIHYSNGSRMQCTTLLPRSAPDGEEIQARAVFTGNVTGSITLTQLVYPDGGRSDTMVLVDLQTLPTSVKDISLRWYIAGRDSETDVYNPYDMPNQVGVQTSCAPQNPLHCKVGDLTSKHGAISAGTRQLLTDPNLPLAGDFTVIGRALVVTTDSPALHTTDLLPNVPVTSILIPRETPFNKSAFREAISEALKTPSWKVTILPDMKGIDNTCLQVNFFVIGYNDSKSLASLQAQGLSGPLHNLTTCPPGSVPAGGAFIEAALPHAALYYLMVYLQLLCFS